MDLEEFKKTLLFWSDISVLPIPLGENGAGTIVYIYDENNDRLLLKGLRGFIYSGNVEDILKIYDNLG